MQFQPEPIYGQPLLRDLQVFGSHESKWLAPKALFPLILSNEGIDVRATVNEVIGL